MSANIVLALIVVGFVVLVGAPFVYLPASLIGLIMLVIGYKAGKRLTAKTDFISRDAQSVKAEGLKLVNANRRVAFDYVDVDGVQTHRTVSITGISRQYLRGYCYLRGDFRTFRFDRVRNDFIDADTGEVLTASQVKGF